MSGKILISVYNKICQDFGINFVLLIFIRAVV